MKEQSGKDHALGVEGARKRHVSEIPKGSVCYPVCRESDPKNANKKLRMQDKRIRKACEKYGLKTGRSHKRQIAGWKDEWFGGLKGFREEAQGESENAVLLFEVPSRGRRPEKYDPTKNWRKTVSEEIERKFQDAVGGIDYYLEPDEENERSEMIRRNEKTGRPKKGKKATPHSHAKNRRKYGKEILELHEQGKSHREVAEIMNGTYACNPPLTHLFVFRFLRSAWATKTAGGDFKKRSKQQRKTGV